MGEENLYWDSEQYGKGYDCEDCGWTADEIRVVEWEPDELVARWEVSVSSGCYGGWNDFYANGHEALTGLREQAVSAYNKDVRAAMSELANRLEEHLA